MAEEWLISPPISLAIAMPKLARPATTTVPVLSPPDPCSGLPVSPCTGGAGGPGVATEVGGDWGAGIAAPGAPPPPPPTPPPRPRPDPHQKNRPARAGGPP